MPEYRRERNYPTRQDSAELVSLYHTAKTAGETTKHGRLVWAANQFAKFHPDWSKASAYKAVTEAVR